MDDQDGVQGCKKRCVASYIVARCFVRCWRDCEGGGLENGEGCCQITSTLVNRALQILSNNVQLRRVLGVEVVLYIMDFNKGSPGGFPIVPVAEQESLLKEALAFQYPSPGEAFRGNHEARCNCLCRFQIRAKQTQALLQEFLCLM